MKRLLLSTLAPCALLAQLGGAPAGGNTSVATQLPLSGRSGQSGSAIAAQSPIPGATTSVNTLNTNVQVTGPYAGSTPSAAKTPFSGKLTLNEAVQRAMAYNLGAIGLSTAVRQAQGQSRVARSVLLPNLNGAFRENYLTEDLQAMGIRVPFLPAIVGPIGYFDLRATLTQNFFDLTSLNNYRASKEIVQANQQALQDARDTIVLAVGATYLQAIAAKARVDSAKAQLDTAAAIFKQTQQRRQAGVAAQLEVNQNEVRERTQRQRIATLENDLARQKINLARLTGLPPNDKYELADHVGFSPAPQLTVDDAVKQALDSRADLKAAEAQLRAAERSKAAAKAERLPTLAVSADLGEIGPRFDQGAHTYTVAGSLKIPIWQGGRAGGDLEQSEAALDQRQAELADTRGRIESDVRNAFLDLEAAASQLDLAKSNQSVSRESLRLTREKFDAGVSDSVEVTQAEEAVASADLDYITALFAHNLAKLSLARALGQAEKRLPAFLIAEPTR
ncbi:MAG: TolC family protein [Acidobacteriota bacterium]|nr:TolC family protein [Acidobacteriota bacterium]